ncbi:MAG: hypothetical protein ACLVJB_11015, partial [Christensenellales bacterium]
RTGQAGARQRPQRSHPRVRGKKRLLSGMKPPSSPPLFSYKIKPILRMQLVFPSYVFTSRGSFSRRKFSLIKPAHFSR